MQPLAITLEDSRFRYDQVCREGRYALYRQTHKASGVVRFEVIRIRVDQEHTWPDGRTTPVQEAYPSAQQWGRQGWTFFSLDAAEAHLASLTHEALAALEAP